jgi:lipoyl(octanoyl) transferase
MEKARANSARVCLDVELKLNKPQIKVVVNRDKIAAIGIRLRKWVSFHGISINVEPDLNHFSGIVPCGISDYGVTSLVDLGLPVTLDDLDVALRQTFDSALRPAACTG